MEFFMSLGVGWLVWGGRPRPPLFFAAAAASKQ